MYMMCCFFIFFAWYSAKRRLLSVFPAPVGTVNRYKSRFVSAACLQESEISCRNLFSKLPFAGLFRVICSIYSSKLSIHSCQIFCVSSSEILFVNGTFWKKHAVSVQSPSINNDNATLKYIPIKK